MYKIYDSLTTSGDFEVTNTGSNLTAKLQTADSATARLIAENGSIYRINLSITPTSDVQFADITTTEASMNQLSINPGVAVINPAPGSARGTTMFGLASVPAATPVDIFNVLIPAGAAQMVIIDAVCKLIPTDYIGKFDIGSTIHIAFLVTNAGVFASDFTDRHRRTEATNPVIADVSVILAGNSYFLRYFTNVNWYGGSTDFWSTTVEIILT